MRKDYELQIQQLKEQNLNTGNYTDTQMGISFTYRVSPRSYALYKIAENIIVIPTDYTLDSDGYPKHWGGAFQIAVYPKDSNENLKDWIGHHYVETQYFENEKGSLPQLTKTIIDDLTGYRFSRNFVDDAQVVNDIVEKGGRIYIISIVAKNNHYALEDYPEFLNSIRIFAEDKNLDNSVF